MVWLRISYLDEEYILVNSKIVIETFLCSRQHCLGSFGVHDKIPSLKLVFFNCWLLGISFFPENYPETKHRINIKVRISLIKKNKISFVFVLISISQNETICRNLRNLTKLIFAFYRIFFVQSLRLLKKKIKLGI